VVASPGAEKPRIAVACADGNVYLMDSDANLLAALNLEAGAELLGVLRVNGKPALLAATGTALTCATP